MKKIEIAQRTICCGCSACAEICPKNCINMLTDNEGFWYPDIDESKCLGCHLCEKVCPVLNVPKMPDEIPKAYASYACDEKIRMESSSGGLFTILAEEIIREGGTVFGAVFEEDFKVRHMGIKTIEDLKKMRGSKYLQSKTYGTYFDVEKLLKDNKLVLYSGTGCQIAGLVNFLGKQYDNLYTIDLLCHGVPSAKVWKKYLIWQENGASSKVAQVSFRNKFSGWKTYSVDLLFSNSTKYVKKYNEDAYMKLFLSDICLRPSCHDCKFKSLSRCSDITLGDFWGIEKIAPEMHDNKGTSLVMIHTKNGEELLNKVRNYLRLEEVDANIALPDTMDSRKSVKAHKNRDKLFTMLDDCSINELVKLVEKPWYVTFVNKVKTKLRKVSKKIINLLFHR